MGTGIVASVGCVCTIVRVMGGTKAGGVIAEPTEVDAAGAGAAAEEGADKPAAAAAVPAGSLRWLYSIHAKAASYCLSSVGPFASLILEQRRTGETEDAQGQTVKL